MSQPNDAADLRAALECLREVDAERWAGWRAVDAAAWRAAELRFGGIEQLHHTSAQALERRVDDLQRGQTELTQRIALLLPAAVHARDMERLYNERQQHNATATQARIQAEQTAAGNRRALLATMIAASVSILSVVVTVLLHFIDSLKHP